MGPIWRSRAFLQMKRDEEELLGLHPVDHDETMCNFSRSFL
jgi:hypothetical protein